MSDDRGVVIDASIAIKLVITEVDSERADRLDGRRLLAPDLLWSECANILWKTVRRGLVSANEAELACEALLRLPFEIADSATLLPEALRRSITLGHPAYDCIYLELAARERLPLVTADQRLLRLGVPDLAVIGLDGLA